MLVIKCYICDREDDLIAFNRQQGDFDPCHVCQAVIDDCIVGYETNEDEPEVLELE